MKTLSNILKAAMFSGLSVDTNHFSIWVSQKHKTQNEGRLVCTDRSYIISPLQLRFEPKFRSSGCIKMYPLAF